MLTTIPGPLDSVTAVPAAESSPQTQPHLLRVLIVDDNAVNLAVLGKLLRKNFSHLLDGPPVAVDSALKALQLLQDNVYDLILMDIQMPFLSGVDCTRRIRQGVDGVLNANRQTTIVAVTTAIGTEPEALYRRSGFDGLIGKPVKSEAMTHLLEPLLAAAREAAPNVEPVIFKGQTITPPLPVVPITGERCFFMPQTSGDSDCAKSTAPSITKTRNFEALLNEQTRISLFRYGACAIARTNSAAGVSDRRRIRDYDVESSSSSPSIGSSEDEKSRREAGAEADLHGTDAQDNDSSRVRSSSSGPSPKWSRAGRGHSLTISQSGLNEQIHREMQAADMHVRNPHVRQRPHPARLSAPTIVFLQSSPEKVSAGSDTTTEDAVQDLEESYAIDEPLSPFSHFGNSGNRNMSSQLFASLQQRAQQQQQQQQQQSSPSKSRSNSSAAFGARWAGSPYGVNRRSSSMGGSVSSADSSSPGSGTSSSRSGSLSTDFDGVSTTPLTTPDTEHNHFALAPIEEHKVGCVLEALLSPLSAPNDDDAANAGAATFPNVPRAGSATLPRTKTSPWRPPLERQTATREVVTVARVLHEQFKDFRI